MAAHYVYGPDRTAVGPSPGMYLSQKPVPVTSQGYPLPSAIMPQPVHQQQLAQQNQPQVQFQNPASVYQAIPFQRQQLPQQFGPDQFSSLLATDPLAAQAMFSSAMVGMNDVMHLNSGTEDNSMIMDLLANDFAASIANGAASGEMYFYPPSPGHMPPDLLKVQQISDQYSRTGDAPYIASAALFRSGWDGVDFANMSPQYAQYLQQSQQMRESQQLPASMQSLYGMNVNPNYSQSPYATGGPFTRPANSGIAQQSQHPARQQQFAQYNMQPIQNGDQNPPVQQQFQSRMQQPQQTFKRPFPPQNQSQPQQPAGPQQNLQPSPQLHQGKPRQSARDDSLQFSKVNWSDLQPTIINSPANSNTIPPSPRQVSRSLPPSNHMTPVSNAQSPALWGQSPASGPPMEQRGMSTHDSPTTPGSTFFSHQRTPSFPVHANVTQNGQIVAFNNAPGGSSADVAASTHFVYPQTYSNMQQDQAQLHGQTVTDGDLDILDFERSLELLSQSIDQSLTPNNSTLPNTGYLPPNQDAKSHKPRSKRRDSAPPSRKTKEQIQADKEEKARLKAERQRIQKEKTEEKKAAQAAKRAQEEQVMREIRENLARRESEIEKSRTADDSPRSDGSEKRFKTNSGDSTSPPKSSQAPGLFPDTQPYAQSQFSSAFVPRAPPQKFNAPQVKNVAANTIDTPISDYNSQAIRPPMSPFVYNLKEGSTASTPSFTPVSSEVDSPYHSSIDYVSPQRAEYTTSAVNEETIVKKTPAPTQALISAQSAAKNKSFEKLAATRLPQKRMLQAKSKLQAITALSAATMQDFQRRQSAAAIQPGQGKSPEKESNSLPLAQQNISDLPNTTSSPAVSKPGDARVAQFGSQDIVHTTQSQDSSISPGDVYKLSASIQSGRRSFVDLSNAENGQPPSAGNHAYMTKIEQDLQDIFASSDDMGMTSNGDGGMDIFHSINEPGRNDDGVLGDVIDKVEEWSKSLKWDINEEAMRLGDYSSSNIDENSLSQ